MSKPSIAELLNASGHSDFTMPLVMRAMYTLYGNIGANRDERDWTAIMQSSNPLLTAEDALLGMYQDGGYLLRNTQHLVQSGYVAAQAEITYRQLADRLGFTHQPGWSQGTAYENLGTLTMEQLVALVPIPPTTPSDSTLPTIISVAITAASGVQNDTLNAGDVLSVTVTMSEATTVTTTGGTPQLALDIGGTTVQASYASGSGSTALVFNYTLQPGQTDADGIAVAANSMGLNGGTLKDAAGNNAALAHGAVATNASYRVDTTAPTATLSSMVQLGLWADYSPQITAVGSSGEFVVTWQGVETAGDYSIFVQKFNADGTTTGQAPVQLEAIGKNNGYDGEPQTIAVGSSGDFVVTWSGWDNNGDNSIFVQKFNADGTTGPTPVKLEAIGKPNGSDDKPQIAAVGSTGEFVVTWHGMDSAGDNSIFVQKFNDDGTITGQAPVQLEAIGRTNGGDYYPQITAVGSTGEFVVTWYGQDAVGVNSIFVQKFNADGSVGPAAVQLEAIGRTNGDDLNPQITAVGSSGEFVVTWQGQDSASDFSIFVQKFNADGSVGPALVQLEATGRMDSRDANPQITAVGADGEFVVTWQGIDSEDDYSIFVQKFMADGTTTGQAPVQLEAIGKNNGYDGEPQITAVGTSGEFVVTWRGEDSAGGDFSIFVQKFNADGTTTGQAPVQLEAIGKNNGYDGEPQTIAVGASGEFVVTWYGVDSVGKDSIFVQKFNAQGQPVSGAALVSPGASVQVRASEMGTAYLVKSTVVVTSLADITGAADAQWNQVAITAANTDTALPTTGLGDGTYHVYTADAAGNLSAPSGTVTVDGTAPWAYPFTATATAVGATSTESGTLGLYDGSNSLLAKAGGGTFSAPMAANTAASIALQAQAAATTATLKVLDAAGNVAADTRTVVLGTGGNDAALAGTGGADFLFGFAGNDRFVFNSVFGSSSDSHINTGVDTITDLAAGDVVVANLGNVGTFDASSSNYVVTNRWADGNLLILDASGTDNDGTNDAGSIRIDIRNYDPATAAAQVQYHITGTSGADTIVTGGQNDTITGGEGRDTLTGGAGADTFAYVVGDASSRSYTTSSCVTPPGYSANSSG